MTFKKYNENILLFIRDKDQIFHLLCLVSDTTKLIEKVKYFKNENSLIMSDFGDVIYRIFCLFNKFEIEITDHPLDLESMKLNTPDLKLKFTITEGELLQNFIFEVGLIANVITENIKYDITTFTEEDEIRIKTSLYSYLSMILILISKLNYTTDKILEFNLMKLKSKYKVLNTKIKEA